MRLDWQDTFIGQQPFTETKIADTGRGYYALRFDTSSKNTGVAEMSDRMQSGYEEKNKEINYDEGGENQFATEVLDSIADALDKCFKSMKQNQSRMTNINENLKTALNENYKIYPREMVVTGDGNKIVAMFELRK